MHTHEGATHTYHFNSDFSGEIVIMSKDKENPKTIKIPAEEILELVAHRYILPERQARLEHASTKDLLLGD